MENKTKTFKIAVLGEHGVGKTALIRQFISQSFSENYRFEVGINISVKVISINETNLKLIIWDLAGEKLSLPLPDPYLNIMDGIVYAIDHCDTEKLDKNILLLQRFKNNNHTPLVVALNKFDLSNDEVVYHSVKSAMDYKVIPTSARNGLNVDCLFHNLANEITMYDHDTKILNQSYFI